MSWIDGTDFSPTRMRRLSGAIPPSYTVFKYGSTYYAETNIPGGTDYSGTDPVTIIHSARDALAATGGTIFLRESVLESNTYPIVLNADGVSLIGSGSGRNQEDFATPPSPLARLTKGTILKNTGTNTDTIQISGKVWGVAVKHLGIDFTQAVTGHGINCIAPANDVGLRQFHIEDIYVNDLDASSYALRMETPLYGYLERLSSIGGGLLEIDLQTTTNPSQISCGNITGNELFNSVTKAMTTSPFWIHRTATSGVNNLYCFNHIQVNSSLDLTTTPVVRLWNMDWSTFTMLNLEAESDLAIDIGSSAHLNFFGPMAYNCTDWNVANTCNDINVFGGYINMQVVDGGTRNTYFGTQITSRHAATTAKFVDCSVYVAPNYLLTDNEGNEVAAATPITVTHGLYKAPTAANNGRIKITALTNQAAAGNQWVDTIGAATFNINWDGGGNVAWLWEASVNK